MIVLGIPVCAERKLKRGEREGARTYVNVHFSKQHIINTELPFVFAEKTIFQLFSSGDKEDKADTSSWWVWVFFWFFQKKKKKSLVVKVQTRQATAKEGQFITGQVLRYIWRTAEGRNGFSSHLLVHTSKDTTVTLEQFWPNSEWDNERAVSVCGQCEQWESSKPIPTFHYSSLTCNSAQYSLRPFPVPQTVKPIRVISWPLRGLCLGSN